MERTKYTPKRLLSLLLALIMLLGMFPTAALAAPPLQDLPAEYITGGRSKVPIMLIGI